MCIFYLLFELSVVCPAGAHLAGGHGRGAVINHWLNLNRSARKGVAISAGGGYFTGQPGTCSGRDELIVRTANRFVNKKQADRQL